MLRRTYLGLEIHPQGLRAVAGQRQGKNTTWLSGKAMAFTETVLQPALVAPNVTQPDLFVKAVKELLSPLAKKETRIAVALPDNCGQLFLLDIETPFKNRDEGLEIIRWRLKDLLPDNFSNVALDFQVLDEGESGQKKVLAAVMSREVLAQYEDLFEQAGYAATIIDFHSLALYSAYHDKIALGDDCILLAVDGCQLSIMIIVNKLMVFCRLKQIDPDPQQVFQELNRSLVTYRNEHSGFNHLTVHLHSDWQNREELFTAVDSVFDQEVQWLPSPISKFNVSQLNLSATESMEMATAVGVAERMIQRVVS